MLKINDLNVSYGASQVLFGVDLQANLGGHLGLAHLRLPVNCAIGSGRRGGTVA